MSQFCTCHDSWAAITCENLWSHWIIRIIIYSKKNYLKRNSVRSSLILCQMGLRMPCQQKHPEVTGSFRNIPSANRKHPEYQENAEYSTSVAPIHNGVKCFTTDTCHIITQVRMWENTTYTETAMSFWINFHHCLHRKLSKWQLPVQPVMKIYSKWWHSVSVCKVVFITLLIHQGLVIYICVGELGKHWFR